VAPSLLRPFRDQPSSLQTVVGTAREAAVRRAEMVRLHVDRSGAWQASAGISPTTEILMSGRLSDTRGSLDLLFSPLGTCGPSPEAAPPEALGTFDPLTCEPRSR